MNIQRLGSEPSQVGSKDTFTGKVRRDRLFDPTEPSRVSASYVTFEPGARTAWHTHPLGQTLVIVAGVAWIQCWDDKIEELHAGDVVTFAPGEKHWHGASATVGMTHLAIQETLDGRAVDWMEHVTDDQYAS
jgi:quercetin dioxygenase-like cupin family protein